MNNQIFITVGKLLSHIIQSFNLGNGSTWPGHLALKGNKNFIKDILSKSDTKIVVVAGTNGKTTTSSLIKNALEKNGHTVMQNESGANLLNGVASALILNTNTEGYLTQNYTIFEVDENALPGVLDQLTPDYLVLLNLFRDQLDRYGEINTIAKKWQEAVDKLSDKTVLILNADDPQVAYIGIQSKRKTYYFGIDGKKSQDRQNAADSISCPKCGNKLSFEAIAFSHLGNWKCDVCGLRHPENNIQKFPRYPLPGAYNKYNTLAAVSVLRLIGLNENEIIDAFRQFIPIFGRQEKIIYREKTVQLFLSKNPTSFNQSYQTIKELQGTILLLVLNDRIPDGRDVSWIWDTDLSEIEKFHSIIISGDRAYDMALRIQYEQREKWKNENLPAGWEGKGWKIEPDLQKAVNFAINQTPKSQTLFILPTYSAMLDVRKILTGRRIL